MSLTSAGTCRSCAALTSAAGVSALLDEKDPKLQAHALQKLDSIVDRFWAELADSVPRMYVCSEACVADE